MTGTSVDERDTFICDECGALIGPGEDFWFTDWKCPSDIYCLACGPAHGFPHPTGAPVETGEEPDESLYGGGSFLYELSPEDREAYLEARRQAQRDAPRPDPWAEALRREARAVLDGWTITPAGEAYLEGLRDGRGEAF